MPVVVLEVGGPQGDDTETRVDFDDILTSLWGATEFWRNDTNDVSTAVLLDIVQGTTFRDWVTESGTYYYWGRLVTPAGQRGEFSDPVIVEV